MKTKSGRKKLMADLKLATKNCTESIAKTHATENEKNCRPVLLLNLLLCLLGR